MKGYNPYHEQQDTRAPYYGVIDYVVVPLTEANMLLYKAKGYKVFLTKPEAVSERKRQITRDFGSLSPHADMATASVAMLRG